MVVDLPGGEDTAVAVALQANGRLVIGARATTVPRRGLDFAVVRLTREGAIDFTFAANGVAYVTFGDGRDALSGIEIDAAGRILAAGTTYPTYPSRPDGLFALAALVP